METLLETFSGGVCARYIGSREHGVITCHVSLLSYNCSMDRWPDNRMVALSPTPGSWK